MKLISRSLSAALLLFFALTGYAADTITTTTTFITQWKGKCVGVTDGDTISVMHDGKAEKIRLDAIDCPELTQAWGNQAKKATSSLVFGKDVTIKDKGKDRYGRTLATVIEPEKNLDVNAILVRNGFAWHYKEYSKDQRLANYEALARKEKKGLWSDPNLVAPWDFRHGTASAIKPTTGTLAERPIPQVSQPIAPLVGGAPAMIAAPTSVQTPSATQSVMVYVTNTGTKYHRAGCRYLARSSIPISLEQAVARYSPCSVCNPPTSAATVQPNAPSYAATYQSTTSQPYTQPSYSGTTSGDRTATGLPI